MAACTFIIHIRDTLIRNTLWSFNIFSSFQYFQSDQCIAAHYNWIIIHYPIYLVSDQALESVQIDADEPPKAYRIHFNGD